MARVIPALATFLLVACLVPTAVATEGINGHVVRIDQAKRCLWLDWDNDTEKIACWTERTKFSVLETEKAARPTDVRKGSYLRMQGAEKDGTYWATDIVIWKAASDPPEE